MRPKKLLHLNSHKSDDRQELAERAITRLHICSEAANLLRYYAAQSSGFRPSAKEISKHGVANARRARAKLAQIGLLRVVYDSVLIDWARLRVLVATSMCLTKAPSKKLYEPRFLTTIKSDAPG